MSTVTYNERGLISGSTRRDPLLPSGPFLAWVDAHLELLRGWGAHEDKGGCQALAARRINQLRHGAALHFATADKLCCILGVHPAEIWGDLYWELELP